MLNEELLQEPLCWFGLVAVFAKNLAGHKKMLLSLKVVKTDPKITQFWGDSLWPTQW